MTSLRDHLRHARARLEASGIPPGEAALDAELLARHALGWDRASFVARTREAAPGFFAARYDPLVARRAAREPMAYIRGVQEFWGREFVVSPAVLIPRPETELVIEEALDAIARAPGPADALRALDVGTGSGCLAITLAIETGAAGGRDGRGIRRNLAIVATDISEAAVEVACENARRLVGADAGRAIEFRLGPYEAGATGPFDLVVANPPYVADADTPTLPPEVGGHEPAAALSGGPGGLRDIDEIVRRSAGLLKGGGVLVMEIGADQAEPVRDIVENTTGLRLLRIRPDFQDIPRVLVVRRT